MSASLHRKKPAILYRFQPPNVSLLTWPQFKRETRQVFPEFEMVVLYCRQEPEDAHLVGMFTMPQLRGRDDADFVVKYDLERIIHEAKAGNSVRTPQTQQ